MRRSIFIFMFIVLFSFLSGGGYSQEETIIMNDAGFAKMRKAPVFFKHDAHNETAEIEECNECHHVYENGELSEYDSSEDLSCSECHPAQDENDAPSLRGAFHINCKGCHLKMEAGPIMCGQCHVKSDAKDEPAAN